MRLKVNITNNKADGALSPQNLLANSCQTCRTDGAVGSRLRGRVNRGGVKAGPGRPAGRERETGQVHPRGEGGHTSDHTKKLETRSPHFRIPLTENVGANPPTRSPRVAPRAEGGGEVGGHSPGLGVSLGLIRIIQTQCAHGHISFSVTTLKR